MNKKFLYPITFLALLVCLSVIFAQDSPGDSGEIQDLVKSNTPTDEEISKFQQEFGAPIQAFEGSEIQRPKIEEPAKVPDEVRKYVTDQELIDVYCAMTRWKSGPFFLAINAVKKNVLPAVEQVRELDIEVDLPDFDALKVEGEAKVDSICQAKSVAEAEQLIGEFSAWGQTKALGDMSGIKDSLQSKLSAKGDELRQKIKSEIDAIVQDETVKMESELRQEAQALADAKIAEIEAAQDPNVDIEAVKAELEQQMEAKVALKKSELEQIIRQKSDELLGGQKEKYENIATLFEGMNENINADIQAGLAQYEQYKIQAFELRKKLVFKVLDQNIEEGLAQLEKAAPDMEEARKEDPSLKTFGEIKSEIQQDRKALEEKLDAALESGDEIAFQQALNDFRIKWETYRQDAEKAASQGVSKACTIALAQFTQARNQIDPGIAKIKKLQEKCANSVTDECLKVNEFSSRLDTMIAKLSDIKAEMDMAESMCQSPETADRNNLIALMKKIQADGEDVKIYGEALEADKIKAIADSVKKICAQALPQLDAAKAELKKNDILLLKSNLDKCKGKSTDECKMVNQLSSDFQALNSRVAAFFSGIDEVQKLCQAGASEEDIIKVAAILNALKSEGESIRLAAKKLEADAAEKASGKAFCRATLPQISSAKSEISAGLKQILSIQAGCQGKSDQKCSRINYLSGKFADLKNQSERVLKKISEANSLCEKAGAEPPKSELVSALQSVQEEGKSLRQAISDLKSESEKNVSGSGIWIEAESASNFNTRSGKGISDPMAREVNPSWRPPYYGDGSWYMGRGNDFLEYNFNVPSSGNYSYWIRDYASNLSSQWGVRIIIVYFDGKKLGSFPENTAGRSESSYKGAFRWHKVESVYLSAGSHKMKIVKQSSTSGAAILDAFYLTTGQETPPEK